MPRPKAFDRHDKAEVLRLRLVRALRSLSTKTGLDFDKLDLMADRCLYRCAICCQPFTSPRIYYVTIHPTGEQVPRGVICPYCDTAIKKCGNDVRKMLKHERFLNTRPARRKRVGRIFDLDYLRGPFDEGFDDVLSAP